MKSKYLPALMLLVLQSPLEAQQFSLGTAQNFAVLSGSKVTNTGSTVIVGDIGVSPGIMLTGFPDGIVTPPAMMHINDATAVQAQSDAATSYHVLAGLTPTQDLTGQDLGGLILLPGIYHFDSSAQLTSTLTLNSMGNPDSLFVFQIDSTLTTASNSAVLFINGDNDFNVFWQVGSSATLGTMTAFKGNILADQSISLASGAGILSGRALAQNGTVTLDTNAISNNGYPFVSGPPGTFVTAVPEPSTTTACLGMTLILSGVIIRRQWQKNKIE